MNKKNNKQIFNPYLPSYEYIPDGEPHIFGDRLYIYGSHDRFGGSDYCENDYVCWSAPVDDLSDWHFEGEIYNRKQHPYRHASDYENLSHSDLQADILSCPNKSLHLRMYSDCPCKAPRTDP